MVRKLVTEVKLVLAWRLVNLSYPILSSEMEAMWRTLTFFTKCLCHFGRMPPILVVLTGKNPMSNKPLEDGHMLGHASIFCVKSIWV